MLCRYVLDGDREELRNIRHELANLRSVSTGQIGGLRQATATAPVTATATVQGQGAEQTQTQTQTSIPHPTTAQGQSAQYQQGVYHDTQLYRTDFQQLSPYAQPYIRASVPTTARSDQGSGSLNLNIPAGLSRGVTMVPPTVPANVLDVRRDSLSPSPSAAPHTYKMISDTVDSNLIETRSRAIDESEIFSENEEEDENEEEEEEEMPRSGVKQAEAPLRPVTADPTRSFYESDHTQRGVASTSIPTLAAHTDTQQQHQSLIAQQASETVRNLRQQIQDLLDTGVYGEEGDPVIQALRAELLRAQRE